MQTDHEVGQMKRMNIMCRICERTFQDKRNFMHHRKSMHPEAIAFCRNESEGKCPFSSDKCWWKHREENNLNTLNIECFICHEKFSSKDAMMIHRKREHPNMVKYCTKINTNECKFGENECWFKHSGENIQEESLENRIKDMSFDDKPEESGFHNVHKTTQIK